MVGYFQDHLNEWNRTMTKNVVGISGDMTPSDRNLKDNVTVIPVSYTHLTLPTNREV